MSGPRTLLLVERGRCEHVLDLGRADAKREGPKGTVRRGVRVTAHACHTGDGEALLGSDGMHDALTLIGHAKVAQVELLHVALDSEHLLAALVVLDERRDV
jgi:hypothetical protein